MLSTEQVLDLVAAGFSAEEIKNFDSPNYPSLPPEDAQIPETPPQESEHPEEEQEQTQETVTRTEFEEMKKAMEELTKAIKANNILTASKETKTKTLTAEEAADAAIKAFFNA